MNIVRYLVVLFITFAGALTVPVAQESENLTDDVDYSQNEIVRRTPNFVMKCSISSKDIMSFLSCAAEETLSIIRRVSKIRSLDILPGLSAVSNGEESRKTEEVQLPADPNQKFFKLVEMIFDATSEFISGRTIKVEFPDFPETSAAISGEEARGKKKKKRQIFDLILKILAIKLMSYGPAIAIVGGIALKALLAAKLAFILATVLGVQSLFGSSGGGIAAFFKGNSGGGSNQGWNSNMGGWESPHGSGGGWDRSFKFEDEHNQGSITAQELAYLQQKPY
ncbi:uncharacterized protein LOC108734512 [Agrilus planipennis]|uniref:Uncharacterized protein LOC108734512 n=1 Tax=Agrilus planipennis TaxID=224129 RepID=A0A1W4WMC3_AGRPL|nr:uncharacterized protein LOC108734512 [Agrilus planipennis]